MRKQLTALVLVFSFALTAQAVVQLKSNAGGANARKPRPEPGRILFENHCAACHESDGRGAEDEAPPLVDSSWVSRPEVRLIKIVLHGMRGPVKVGERIYNREMPGFGQLLNDAKVASLLSFMRKRWGNSAAAITSKTVGQVRAATQGRKEYWTVKELLEEP